MGGKPWTSGGCRTCKKRKLKCDEQKPKCARCTKRGIECLGYVERRIFVHQASTQPEILHDDTQRSTHLLQYSRRAREFVLPGTPSASPVMRVQLSSSFLDTYFPSHMEKIAGIDSWYFLFTSWVTFPSKSELFDRALSALCCICLGRTNEDRGLYHHGLLQYNKAIRLQSNMINRGLCSEEMLYSALVFVEIESFSCPEGMEAWYTHAIGAYALIKMYRNKAEISKSPAMTCLLNRFAKLLMILIISSLNVSGEEYKQIVQSSHETPFDGLVKLYADSAIIAQAANSINPLDYKACQLLLHHSLAHEHNIITWYQQIQEEIGGAPWECAEGELLCSRLARKDDLFGTPFRFTSLENARIHILVWNLLRDLQPYISKARSLGGTFTHDDLSRDQINRESQLLAVYYADQMARSVLYCVQNDFKSCGIQCLIFCLCQTAKTWIAVKRADKIAWCQEIFDFVAGLGFDYANRLKETMMSQWVQGEKSISGGGGLTPVKDEVEGVGEIRDMAGVGLSALPGMLGKPSMLDVPELSSMSSTVKLLDSRLDARIPVREKGSM